jgi:hypothetical protein
LRYYYHPETETIQVNFDVEGGGDWWKSDKINLFSLKVKAEEDPSVDPTIQLKKGEERTEIIICLEDIKRLIRGNFHNGFLNHVNADWNKYQKYEEDRNAIFSLIESCDQILKNHPQFLTLKPQDLKIEFPHPFLLEKEWGKFRPKEDLLGLDLIFSSTGENSIQKTFLVKMSRKNLVITDKIMRFRYPELFIEGRFEFFFEVNPQNVLIAQGCLWQISMDVPNAGLGEERNIGIHPHVFEDKRVCMGSEGKDLVNGCINNFDVLGCMLLMYGCLDNFNPLSAVLHLRDIYNLWKGSGVPPESWPFVVMEVEKEEK